MSWLTDILRAYGEGEAIKEWGPGWRTKLDQLKANLALTGMQGERVAAETRNLDLEGRSRQQKLDSDQATIDYFKRNGGSEAVAKYLQSKAESDAQIARSNKLNEATDVDIANAASPEEARAARAAAIRKSNAEAGYYSRRNSDGGYNLYGAKWVQGPDGQPALLTKGGDLVSESAAGQRFGPPQTAEQRNMERYDIMVPAQIDQIDKALSNVEQLGWTGGAAGLVPGTSAHRTVELYDRLVTGLAATAARAMGDNRISDTDRAAYAALYGVANQLVGLPPGAKLARQLLEQTKELIGRTALARQQAKIPGAGMVPPDSGDSLAEFFKSNPR